jgi:hypothetical protein
VIDQLIVLVDSLDAVRREALDGERASDSDLLVVLVRLVIEELEFGLGGDRRIDLCLAADTGFPPVGVNLPSGIGSRAPEVHPMAKLADDGSRVVFLCGGRNARALVEDQAPQHYGVANRPYAGDKRI